MKANVKCEVLELTSATIPSSIIQKNWKWNHLK